MADHGEIEAMEDHETAGEMPAAHGSELEALEAGAAGAETAAAEPEPAAVARKAGEPAPGEGDAPSLAGEPAQPAETGPGAGELAVSDEPGAEGAQESARPELLAGEEESADESSAGEAVAQAGRETGETATPAGTPAGAEPGAPGPASGPAGVRRGRALTDRAEMEAVLEAVLFVASEPIGRARLLELFDEEEREEAAQALEAVLARYSGEEGRGVMAEEVAGGIRLVTRPELVGWLRRFFEVSGGSKLSMAALETLAIVAYRQPITGPEIQELRGVNSSGVLSTLLQRRLVRIAGRKEVVGKPFLYATTREFLVHFGLKSLKDLPPLEEFEETFAEGGAGAALALGGGAGEGGAPAGGEDREERILQEIAALEEGAAEGPEADGEGLESASLPRSRSGREGGRSNGGAPAAAEPSAPGAEEPGEPGWAGGLDGSGDADAEGA